jgi:protein ImuA
MAVYPLHRPPTFGPAPFPADCQSLEEASAAEPGDAAAAFAFAIDRLARLEDARPLIVVTTALWSRERGRPFARGLRAWGVAPERLLWLDVKREAEALWALEEALKSGAVAGGLATIEAAPFVATRRLDFAARSGDACGVLVRATAGGDLSAARRRWRIRGRPSQGAPFDARSPGAPCFTAELVRRRDGPPGLFELEQDHETGRLRLAGGLADRGVAEAAPGRPAARRSA